MAHKISYLKNSRSVGDEEWNGSMSEAQALGQSAVDSGEYDGVEIRNANGELVWHFPRVMSKAP